MKKVLLILIPIVLVFVAGVFLLNVYVHSKDNPSEADSMVVAELEKQALPLVEQNDIEYFFDSDWCQIIETSEKVAYRLINEEATSNCGSRPSNKPTVEMTESDIALFEDTESKLSNIGNEMFTRIQTEHLLNSEENIGLGFHLDCSFCRTRYVYWPNYEKLPDNVEGEIKYIPINSNWYRVEQDWN